MKEELPENEMLSSLTQGLPTAKSFVEVIDFSDKISFNVKVNKHFEINKIKIVTTDNPREVRIEGVLYPEYNWYCYKNIKIQKWVNQVIKPIIQKLIDKKIKSLRWSEAGMQYENGWSFDINYYKE